MSDREKLIDILERAESAVYWNSDDRGFIEKIAAHLIENGVTVQKWIPVSERLPQPNRYVLVYRPNMAMQILVDEYVMYYDDDENWHEGWEFYGKDSYGNDLVTHWMQMPRPPKGE